MKNLGSTFRRVPFLRILLAFLLGILIGDQLPSIEPVAGLLVLFALTAALIVTYRKSFRWEIPFGAVILSTFFYTGLLNANWQKFNPLPLDDRIYCAILDEFPVQKARTIKCTIKLQPSDRKLLAYFPEKCGADSLKPGSLLLFRGKPQLITNPGNPAEFDYRRYLFNRKIGYRIYLRENDFILVDKKITSLKYNALIIREQLIDILRKHKISGETLDIISSVALGARDDLDKVTLQSFSNTGVIHVLSVSGMHVAIIFLVLNFLFGFLKRSRSGTVAYTVLIIILLWTYTLISGMSPAAIRATAMFSFVVIGNSLQRNPNIYNSLATSAFFMLLIDPFLVFDVGFQLSYVAVTSIVWLYPIIYRQFYFKNWFVDKTWMLLSVSFAAQIGTLPFTLFYFHQFPVYFWLANLLIMITSTLLLYLAFLVFLVDPIWGQAAFWIAQLLKWDTDIMIYSIKLVEVIPGSVIRDIYHPVWFYLTASAFIVTVTYSATAKSRRWLITSICLMLILITLQTVQKYQRLQREEMVVFNSGKEPLIAVTQGDCCTLIADQLPITGDQENYVVKPYLGSRGISSEKIQLLHRNSNMHNAMITATTGHFNVNGVSLVIKNDTTNLSNANFSQFSLIWPQRETQRKNVLKPLLMVREQGREPAKYDLEESCLILTFSNKNSEKKIASIKINKQLK